MKCEICSREAGGKEYCELHARAYENLVRKHGYWEKALGTSWKDYLREIAKNPLTGEWAREVAQYLIEVEDKTSVKNN